MKPVSDESKEFDALKDREMFATFTDDEVGSVPNSIEPTLESATRRSSEDESADPALSQIDHLQPISEGQIQGPGSGSDLRTAVASSSEIARASSGSMNRRGIVGRIQEGQTLYGKYEVLRKLGGGAMGDVWLVRHVMLKSQHALKVIVPNFATNPVALMRFQREFEVMATLRHEHAVIIYDASIDDDGGYIDMEYVDGLTIHQILGGARGRADLDPSEPLVSLDWIVRILEQLCEVLEVAHQNRIVHRDLKPSNLMLIGGRPTGREYLKVLDFGIAKIRDDLEGVAGRDQMAGDPRTQGFIGTPSYGSPEQAMGLEVDGRSDLYSVGVMLYEFVCRQVPFQGHHWQVMSHHAGTPPPRFAEINPDLRPMPQLEKAILRTLAKKPENRPQTARELYQEICKAVETHWPSGSPTRWPNPDAFPSPGLDSPAVGSVSSSHHDEPPTTHAETLVARSGAGNWRGKPATEIPSGLGRPADGPGQERSNSSRRGLAKILILTVAAIAIIGLISYEFVNLSRKTAAPSKAVETVPVQASRDFDYYWHGSGFRPAEEYAKDGPWPREVRRKDGSAVFVRFADGIYLPKSFRVQDPFDEVEGWPRVIVKDGVRFLRMKGGSWVMGSWDVDNAVDQPDRPAHPVLLTGYYIQETEVTHGQIEAYLEPKTEVDPPLDWSRTFNRLKQHYDDEDAARRCPAANVSRELALSFARSFGGDLPTEAQWEFAARSFGEENRYVWGNAPSPDRTRAAISTIHLFPSPARSFPTDTTSQGVFDMTGNVREMCRDGWTPCYAKSSDAVPDPCPAPIDPEKPAYAVRGGYYGSLPSDCSTTRREMVAESYLSEDLGFRMVVECPAPRKPE